LWTIPRRQRCLSWWLPFQGVTSMSTNTQAKLPKVYLRHYCFSSPLGAAFCRGSARVVQLADWRRLGDSRDSKSAMLEDFVSCNMGSVLRYSILSSDDETNYWGRWKMLSLRLSPTNLQEFRRANRLFARTTRCITKCSKPQQENILVTSLVAASTEALRFFG
jgi:hypothetical protein